MNFYRNNDFTHINDDLFLMDVFREKMDQAHAFEHFLKTCTDAEILMGPMYGN